MQVSLIILVVVIAATSAQYNYPTPKRADEGYSYPKPSNKYLPPPPPTTTTPRYVTKKLNLAEFVVPEVEHQAGNPYEFTYSVKEDAYANDYKRNEKSDGENVKGEYRTLMPDGRMQIVQYTADWKNGYNAVVTYEGQAKY